MLAMGTVKLLLVALLGLTGVTANVGIYEILQQVDITIHYDDDNLIQGTIDGELIDTIVFTAEEKKNGSVKFKFYNKDGNVEVEYERDIGCNISKDDKEYIEKILEELEKEREIRRKQQDMEQLQFEKQQELDRYKFDKKGEFQREKEGMNKRSFWDYILGRRS